jgi:hypothetical protein
LHTPATRTSDGRQRLEGPDLEALLDKVRAEHAQARIVEANRVRRGGVAGFFAKETYEVVLEDDGDEDPADDEAVADEEPFVPFTIDELAASVEDVPPAPRVEEDAPTPAAQPAPVAAEVVAPAVSFDAALAAAVREQEAGPWPAATALAEAARVQRLRPITPRTSALGPNDLGALERLGLPTHQLSLPMRTDEPAAVALVRLLEQLPAAPRFPRAAGTVVALLAERGVVVDLAEQLAAEIGADEIVLASPRRGADVREAAAAEDARRSWRRRRRPTLVAVEAPFTVVADAWRQEVLDALEPGLVLARVDAGRKPEDITAWSDAVGGIDALLVEDLASTTTPAAVLGAGIPVARIDGAPATAARWAALLTDRLAVSKVA